MQCGRLRSEHAADLHHQLSRLHCRGGHCCRRSSARPGPALRLQADYPMWTRRTRRHLWLIRASGLRRRRCPLSRLGGSKQSVSFQPSLLIWQCSAECPRRVDRRSSTSRPRTAGSRPWRSVQAASPLPESGGSPKCVGTLSDACCGEGFRTPARRSASFIRRRRPEPFTVAAAQAGCVILPWACAISAKLSRRVVHWRPGI